MALILWTSDNAASLKQAVGTIIRDAGIDHRVEPYRGPIPDSGPTDLVFAMGADCLKSLGQFGVLRKGASVESQRLKLHLLPSGAKCLVSYAAAVKDVDHSRYVDLITDLRLAFRYVQTGSLKPVLGHYRYVPDFSDAIQYINTQFEQTKKPVRVAFDTETVGTDRFSPQAYIVSVQVTVRAGTADVVVFHSREQSLGVKPGTVLFDQLHWLLTSEKVSLISANGKYDYCWMNTFWGLPLPTNFRFDTTIVGSLLDENRSNALNVHAKMETSIGGYDDSFNQRYDKSRMDLALADDPGAFLEYAGGDTDACYRVAEVFREKLLRDDKLARFYARILHPAARAYEIIEQTGWYVDVAYYQHLHDELTTEIERLSKELKSLLGGRLVAKHTDPRTGKLNFAKAALLREFFFTPAGLNLTPKVVTAKTGEPSTAYDHLKMFSSDPKAKPFLDIYKQYAQATKALSTYVVKYDEKTGAVEKGFLAHLRSDGRFHPHFFLYSGYDHWTDDEGGAVSGRLSVKDPPIQTIPAHTSWAERIRRAFIAPSGYLIYGPDFSQGELRIAACRADETTMIEAYRRGIDLHALTGSTISGYTWAQFEELKKTDPKKWEAIRQLGKPSNFGLLYGQKEEGFMRYAVNKYGVDMTLEEATKFREGFFRLYPHLLEWHKREIAHAQRYGFVRSDLGRVRHIPLIHSPDPFMRSRARRQAINSPIQSTLNDMMLWAIAILWKRGVFERAPFFGTVHDQGLQYVPEDNWEKYVAETKEVMENLPFHELGWHPQLKFPVDGKLGPTLGDLKKI
jgi:DNA polymerase I-like protein with 3'-5' exonuclease and polymerase domains